MQKSNIVKVDLHVHTTASDGTWTPYELVNEIIKNSIDMFAVTDHDTTENVNKTRKIAESKSLKFINGVEITSTWGDITPHILGYKIDIDNQNLQALLKKNMQLLEKKDEESIQYLEAKGFNVSYKEYEKYIDNPTSGGWKAFNYAKDKNLCKNHIEFFNLFDNDNVFSKIYYCSSQEAIRAIINAGGIPILAHPGVYFYGDDYKGVIQDMIDQGVCGIECYHPDNSKEVTDYSIKACTDRYLLITGGSDCHGDFVVNRKLGQPPLTLEMLNLSGLL